MADIEIHAVILSVGERRVVALQGRELVGVGGLIVAVVPDHDFVPIGQRRNAFGHAHGGAG